MTELGFADLHLHFEGSIPEETLIAIAARNGHHFSIAGRFSDLRRQVRDFRMFLRLYADCCRIFRTPFDYGEAAGSIARALSNDVRHAEIYVSPEIWARFGFDPGQVLDAIDGALADAEGRGGPRVLLLLDAVRQWGPESAEQVLDLFEKAPSRRIVGFGIGGDESSRSASEFRAVYERAQRLGLRTSIHAGSGPVPHRSPTLSTTFRSIGSITEFARRRIRRCCGGFHGRRFPFAWLRRRTS